MRQTTPVSYTGPLCLFWQSIVLPNLPICPVLSLRTFINLPSSFNSREPQYPDSPDPHSLPGLNSHHSFFVPPRALSLAPNFFVPPSNSLLSTQPVVGACLDYRQLAFKALELLLLLLPRRQELFSWWPFAIGRTPDRFLRGFHFQFLTIRSRAAVLFRMPQGLKRPSTDN